MLKQIDAKWCKSFYLLCLSRFTFPNTGCFKIYNLLHKLANVAIIWICLSPWSLRLCFKIIPETDLQVASTCKLTCTPCNNQSFQVWMKQTKNTVQRWFHLSPPTTQISFVVTAPSGQAKELNGHEEVYWQTIQLSHRVLEMSVCATPLFPSVSRNTGQGSCNNKSRSKGTQYNR